MKKDAAFEAALLQTAIQLAWRPYEREVSAIFAAAGGRDSDNLLVNVDTVTLVVDGVETLVVVRRLFAGAAS